MQFATGFRLKAPPDSDVNHYLWACLLIMILMKGGELPVFDAMALDLTQILGPEAY
jgi:hypothetical protein